jgi:hypothetical protein
MKNTSSEIYKIILSKESGSVFSYIDFESITANKKTIEQNLLRLKEKKIINAVTEFRGLYYKPKINLLIGPVPPAEENIIKAYEKKMKTHFYISGAKAANILGLSNQVPEKSIYYTNKQLKALKIGNREIIFKRKKLNFNEKLSSSTLILSALEYLGKTETLKKDIRIKILKIIQKENNLSELKKLLPYYQKWIKKYIEKVENNIDRNFKVKSI